MSRFSRFLNRSYNYSIISLWVAENIDYKVSISRNVFNSRFCPPRFVDGKSFFVSSCYSTIIATRVSVICILVADRAQSCRQRHLRCDFSSLQGADTIEPIVSRSNKHPNNFIDSSALVRPGLQKFHLAHRETRIFLRLGHRVSGECESLRIYDCARRDDNRNSVAGTLRFVFIASIVQEGLGWPRYDYAVCECLCKFFLGGSWNGERNCTRWQWKIVDNSNWQQQFKFINMDRTTIYFWSQSSFITTVMKMILHYRVARVRKFLLLLFQRVKLFRGLLFRKKWHSEWVLFVFW